MSKASNYYYEQLNKEQQKAYYAMKEGLLNQQDSFAVPMLDKKELSDIYFMVRMDCPEIFYSVRFSYRYYPDSTAVEFIPEYLFQKDKIREHRQAMQARVKKLGRQAQGLDEKGKELFIHDFIVQNVRYDKLKKEYSHEIIGALGNGVAVCCGGGETLHRSAGGADSVCCACRFSAGVNCNNLNVVFPSRVEIVKFRVAFCNFAF